MLGAAVILGMGSFVFGACAAVFLTIFWDVVANWLNNCVADAVGKTLGYNARRWLQKAVCKADRVMQNIHTSAVVFCKSSPMAQYYDKVTLESTAPQESFEDVDALIREIEGKGYITQEMQYKA